MTQGIYKITNKINQNAYIGKAKNLEARKSTHWKLPFKVDNKEYNKALYKAMRKYGLENFSWEILEEIQNYDEEAGKREQYWITKYDTYHNGYNETPGGDGGSAKGHCQGSSNGRAKTSEETVIKIRQKYNEGISKHECYELFKDEVPSFSAFTNIWSGRTWKHIMPEVFTEENKQKNAKLGYGHIGFNKQRKLTSEQVKEIRKARQRGESPKEFYDLNFKNIVSLSSFSDVWYNRSYKDIKLEGE